MYFVINKHTWVICELDCEMLDRLVKKVVGDEVVCSFGITKYDEQTIYINEEMCKDQKIRTLKHELMHCYIWEMGMYNVPTFNDEMVCDLVASSNDFINEIVERYIKENKE